MVSTARPLGHPATRADLEALPGNVKGEIIDGVLYTQPRPRPRHARVAAALGTALFGGFDSGAAGPGGWWILLEPGIELPGAPEVAPDIAGWRREHLPELPDEAISIRPDWVCEVLSPSNRAYDRAVKFPFYARVGVPFLWVVDPEARTLEVRRLAEGKWVELSVHADAEVVAAEPFDAVSVELAQLWRMR